MYVFSNSATNLRKNFISNKLLLTFGKFLQFLINLALNNKILIINITVFLK